MATPTTGTIPALPQYQPGALSIASTVAVEIVDTTNATAASSWRMSQIDFVGKAPGVMVPANPTANDMVAFLQASSNLPRMAFVGNLGVAFGNLPVGGATATFLTKNSAVNYDASWTAILGLAPSGGTAGYVLTKNTSASYDYSWAAASALPTGGATGQVLGKTSGVDFTSTWVSANSLVAAGTSLGTTGSATSVVFSVAAGGIGSTQMGTASVDLTTNIITGLLPMTAGGLGTNALATFALIVSNGPNVTARGIAAATSGFILAGQGITTLPAYVNITTLAVTQITAGGGLGVAQGGTGGSITGTGTLFAQHTPAYKTASYTVVATDLGATIIFTTGSLATCALGTTNATGLGSGFFVDLYNAAATSIVIAPLGGALVTGIGATAIMPAGTGMRVVSDATNWVPQFAAGAYGLHLSKTNQSFSGGIRLVSFNAGTTSGATNITFDSGNGPIQHVRNAGTGTFTAPSSDGELDVLVMATTNASTITFSGFNASTSAPTGDTVTWNATAIYLVSMRRVNGSSTYRVAAYQ